MGSVLGLGVTHYPPLSWPDESMANILRWTLRDPAIPEEWRDRRGWPEDMVDEYGDDGGAAAAARHRMRIRAGFRRVRERLDEFAPDVVVVWGDDQYENFREELVPAFCVQAYGDEYVMPWKGARMPNVWGEDEDTTFTIRGHQAAGRHVASALLEAGFDPAYSYRRLNADVFPHAFLNTVLFLDYERRGFPYPLLSIATNCYGRHLIGRRGGLARFDDSKAVVPDPPSPSPQRCLEFGACVGRVLADSPWRVALVASSSWSHAFLCDKTWRLYPDIDSDRRLFDALAVGDYQAWERVSRTQLEDAGQQEMLNWFCLVGAMRELGLVAEYAEFISTHVFNSDKCFAIFPETSPPPEPPSTRGAHGSHDD